MIYELHDYMHYKHLVASMKTKSLAVYFVQEMWLERDIFDEVINGSHIFRHNRGKGNHNFCGVAATLLRGMESCRSKAPNNNWCCRQICRPLYQHKCDPQQPRQNGEASQREEGRQASCPNTCICLPSVYQDRFRRNICLLPWHTGYYPQQTTCPQQNIMGMDVNANIGRFDKMQSSKF